MTAKEATSAELGNAERASAGAAPELVWETPSDWAAAALADPEALLSDHAHCELGAAASAQGLIARHHDLPRLVDPLSALAAEEMRHFRRVHRLLVELGGTLAPIRQNPYAEGLVRAIDRSSEEALLDRLLVAGLIERRSLERFERLAETADEPLASLFADLGPSEEGHARLFGELALALFPGVDVAARLRDWAVREADLIRSLPPGPRIHSGPPTAISGVQPTRRATEETPAVRLASAAPRP